MMRKRIVCIGDCGIDHYVDADIMRPGGCSLNLAVTLSRLAPSDMRVELVSAVGTDANGSTVLEAIAAEDIVSHVSRMPGETPIQRLTRGGNGERRFVEYVEGVLPSLTFDDAQRRSVANADVLVTVIYRQIERLIMKLLASPRRARLVVDFMDLSDYDRSLEPVAWVLEETQIGFFGLSPHDEELIAQLRTLTRVRPITTIITLGAAGGIAFKGGERFDFAADHVADVTDTTGAGDAFAGAFLSSHATGASLQDSLAFASRHAAKVVCQLGAF